MKILIAEDSAIVRKQVVEALAEVGVAATVAEAGDGIAAIEVFRKLKPHLVILDISMPKRNGLEVLEQIKQEASRTIVIVFTHHDCAPYRARCQAAGADHFLPKNKGFPSLIEIVKELSARFPINRPESPQYGNPV